MKWKYGLFSLLIAIVLLFFCFFRENFTHSLTKEVIPLTEYSQKQSLSKIADSKFEKFQEKVQASKVKSTSSANIEYLLEAFSEVHESSQFAYSNRLQSKIFEKIASDAEKLGLLMTALKDLDMAKQLFGLKQAEARYLGIQVLSYMHFHGNSEAMLDVLQHFHRLDPDSISADKGRNQDYKDLVHAYFYPLSKEDLVENLKEVAGAIGYFDVDPRFREKIYFLLFEKLGVKFLDKTTEILKVLEI